MKARTKTALKILSTIIALFIAVVFIINTSPFDAELNPEVTKIMQPQSMPQVQGNAYFALVGIKTESENNIIDVGFKIIQQHLNAQNKKTKAPVGIENEASSEFQADVDSNWQTYYDHCNSKSGGGCLTQMQQQISAHPITDERLELMLKRYSETINIRLYKNYSKSKADLYMPLGQFSMMMKLSQISLARSHLFDSSKDFLKLLNDDLRFWKMMLNSGTYLLDKMIAVSSIRNDIYYLSTFIKNNNVLSEQELSLIYSLLTPLSNDELDLSKNFIAEARIAFKFYESIESNNSFIDNLFYQPNATINSYFEKNLKPQIQFGKLSLSQLLEARAQEKKTIANNKKTFNSLRISRLYNFIGKVLVFNGGCACGDYVVRGYDLNNIIKMVSIQLQAKISDSENTKQIIAKPENFNPFNNKPFEYDAQTKVLRFDCLGEFALCHINVD